MWSVQEITHLALLNIWTYEISHIWTYEIEHMKSHTPKNSYECKERGKTFKYRSSLNTPESIQARNCTKADNVAKPLQTCQCWACIREFTQARNLTNALNMTKPSSGAHIFFNVTHIEQQNKGSTCGKSFNQKTYLVIHQIRSVRSVAQSCPTLRPHESQHTTPPCPSPTPEFTQTHVHRVGAAIQTFHPLSSPSPPAPNPSQHQSLFQWVNSSHEMAKVLEFQL